MAFRRQGEQPHAWKHWVSRHREELTAAGVPDWILADERRWRHFLEEGGQDAETGWQVELLSPRQAGILHALLTREFSRFDLACCLRTLAEVSRSREK